MSDRSQLSSPMRGISRNKPRDYALLKETSGTGNDTNSDLRSPLDLASSETGLVDHFEKTLNSDVSLGSPDVRWASGSSATETEGVPGPGTAGAIGRQHSSSSASSKASSTCSSDNGWGAVNESASGAAGAKLNRPRITSLKSDRRKSSILFGPGAVGWGKVSEAPLGDVLLTRGRGIHDAYMSGEEDSDEDVYSEIEEEGGENRQDASSRKVGYRSKGTENGQRKTHLKLKKRSDSFNAMMGFQRGVEDTSGVIRKRRRTKIVCAIGPASRSVDMCEQLLNAGMNIARLNFSHGDHEYHLETLRNIKTAVARRQAKGHQCHCAILMDTKGPEIRTGFLENHEPVELKIHQQLEICTDYSIQGNSSRISCSYEHLCASAYVGGTILIADGSISCKVLSVGKSSVMCRVENNAILGERKNMNIPGVTIRLAGITDKDKYDIEHFALRHEVDIVSGSFIRTAANVRSLRECLRDKGHKIRVHAKIESIEGLRNLDEILAEADGVHVSRGDLGMELPLSKLFLAQKTIIHRANLAGKPVVTSTQMLDSMTTKPRPTNAECSDVANAVLDGTDVVMLSAETANGRYPKESVETMARIIAEAEVVLDYDGHFGAIREAVLQEARSSGGNLSVMEALASSAVTSAIDTDAPLIVLMSETGQLALFVAKYRPPARILVVTGNAMTARQMSVSRGLSAFLLDPSATNSLQSQDIWPMIANYISTKGWAGAGDRVVLVASPLDTSQDHALNQTGDGYRQFTKSRHVIDCVEIRIIDRSPSPWFKKPIINQLS